MERSWFFNNGEQYGQDELRKYFTHIYRDGVSVDETGAMELEVASTGSALTLGKGFAIIGGFAYENDAELPIAISADANYTRIDRVVLRLDIASMHIKSALKTGTAGSTPKAPDLERGELVYEISLAQVTITPSGTITVTDERFNQNLCGAIRPKNLSEIDTMIAAYQKQFEDWFNEQKGTGWRNIYVQEETPTEAVSGSLWL